MDKITKRVNGVKAIYPVYTRQEAEDMGIKYKPWKECKDGEFGISDDGYVSECIYTRMHSGSKKKKTRLYMNFAMGVGYRSKYSKIEFEQNKAYGSYGKLNPASSWQDREAKTLRGKQAVQAYVAQLLSDQPIDWDIIGKIYRSDQKVPAATVRRLFKEEKFKKMIDKKIEEVLVKKGITQEMVCEINLEALEMAKKKGDASIMHRIGGTFADWLGMNAGKKVVTDRIEMDMTQQIEETIGKEQSKRKIALERRTETPDTEDRED